MPHPNSKKLICKGRIGIRKFRLENYGYLRTWICIRVRRICLTLNAPLRFEVTLPTSVGLAIFGSVTKYSLHSLQIYAWSENSPSVQIRFPSKIFWFASMRNKRIKPFYSLQSVEIFASYSLIVATNRIWAAHSNLYQNIADPITG